MQHRHYHLPARTPFGHSRFQKRPRLRGRIGSGIRGVRHCFQSETTEARTNCRPQDRCPRPRRHRQFGRPVREGSHGSRPVAAPEHRQRLRFRPARRAALLRHGTAPGARPRRPPRQDRRRRRNHGVVDRPPNGLGPGARRCGRDHPLRHQAGQPLPRHSADRLPASARRADGESHRFRLGPQHRRRQQHRQRPPPDARWHGCRHPHLHGSRAVLEARYRLAG